MQRSLGQIIRANALTPYNAVIATLTVLVATTQRWPDMLVGSFVILNTSIGVTQEVRARRVLERLFVVHAPTVRVQRHTGVERIGVDALVPGDVMELEAGEPVPADGVATSPGLEIDESLLSGESEPVLKAVGDPLLSGSIVVAGRGTVSVTGVGASSYARRLTDDVRRLRRAHSTLVDDTNRLIVGVLVALVVVGPLLVWGELRRDAFWKDAVVDAAAAMGAMVPDGLVLLTSLSFVLAAARLARRHVLTHQLAAVEVLARADTVLLDKTGTLTDGTLELHDIEALGRRRRDAVAGDDPAHPRAVPAAAAQPDMATMRQALGALASTPGPSTMLQAVQRACAAPDGWTAVRTADFSSARRWSAMDFGEHGTWALGAPEVLVVPPSATGRVAALTSAGKRVLVLAHAPVGAASSPSTLPLRPEDTAAVALLVFDETIRPGAADAVAYLARQGITIKVVSGDHPATVAAAARRVGVPGAGDGVRFADLVVAPAAPDGSRTTGTTAATGSTAAIRSGSSDEATTDGLARALAEATVIGRTTPDEKRAIVRALQHAGHVVAMTGDGVNDALALKQADLGIALASGAPATRGVADIVLLDSDFAAVPRLIDEGRRVLGSIERVAHLFLVKVAYAALLALVAGALARPYPFLPRQLTWTAALTIGIPGLVLAGEHADERFRPGYLARVLRRSVPAAVIATVGLTACFEVARRSRHATSAIATAHGRAAASVAAVVIGLGIIVLSGTGSRLERALLVSMVALTAATLAWPWARRQLALDLSGRLTAGSVLVGALVVGAQALVWNRSGVAPAVQAATGTVAPTTPA